MDGIITLGGTALYRLPYKHRRRKRGARGGPGPANNLGGGPT